MHDLVAELLADQHECVGAWQLCVEGWSAARVEHQLRRDLRPVPGLDGVWTGTRGPLSAVQRRCAATLTAPGTALAHVSAALHWGIADEWRHHDRLFVVVVREGNGGRRRHGQLLVHHSLVWDVEVRDGVPVTPCARTLVDIAGWLDPQGVRRALIEALRLRLVDVETVLAEVVAHPRRPGAKRLRPVLAAVSGLPIAGMASNAEATALVRIGDPALETNQSVGGYEADIVDRAARHIIEVDGPAHHADPELDARKDAARRAAGYTVERRPSDDAYDPTARW